MKVPINELPRGPFKMARDYRPGSSDDAMYTDHQAPGAYLNGSRVEKVTFDAGDQHPIGSLATVLGSVGPVDAGRGPEYGYFVIWDAMPEVPVFCRGGKLGPSK